MSFLRNTLIPSIKKLFSSKKELDKEVLPKQTFTKDDILMLSGYLPHFAVIFGFNTEKSIMMIPVSMLPNRPKPVLQDHNGLSYSTLN